MSTYDPISGKIFIGGGILIVDNNKDDVENMLEKRVILFRHPIREQYTIPTGMFKEIDETIEKCCVNRVRELSSNLLNISKSLLNKLPIFDLHINDQNYFRIYLLKIKKSLNFTSKLLQDNQNTIKQNIINSGGGNNLDDLKQ